MAEYVGSNFAESKTYAPNAAVVTITFVENAVTYTDTITLSYPWVCYLIKSIRSASNMTVSLRGCLPAASAELPHTNPTKNAKLETTHMTGLDRFKFWIAKKP